MPKMVKTNNDFQERGDFNENQKGTLLKLEIKEADYKKYEQYTVK